VHSFCCLSSENVDYAQDTPDAQSRPKVVNAHTTARAKGSTKKIQHATVRNFIPAASQLEAKCLARLAIELDDNFDVKKIRRWPIAGAHVVYPEQRYSALGGKQDL
jgi:hypothetical protein